MVRFEASMPLWLTSATPRSRRFDAVVIGPKRCTGDRCQNTEAVGTDHGDSRRRLRSWRARGLRPRADFTEARGVAHSAACADRVQFSQGVDHAGAGTARNTASGASGNSIRCETREAAEFVALRIDPPDGPVKSQRRAVSRGRCRLAAADDGDRGAAPAGAADSGAGRRHAPRGAAGSAR